jgi:hypothetical protein
MSDDPFAPISGAAATAPKALEWQVIVPVPETAPAPFPAHPTLGKPSQR